MFKKIILEYEIIFFCKYDNSSIANQITITE